jgi:hypothetical protein
MRIRLSAGNGCAFGDPDNEASEARSEQSLWPEGHVNGCRLFQVRVFGFCSDEDGDVGVGIFPKREEILIGGAGFGSLT